MSPILGYHHLNEPLQQNRRNISLIFSLRILFGLFYKAFLLVQRLNNPSIFFALSSYFLLLQFLSKSYATVSSIQRKKRHGKNAMLVVQAVCFLQMFFCSKNPSQSGLEVIFLVHLQSFGSKIFFD